MSLEIYLINKMGVIVWFLIILIIILVLYWIFRPRTYNSDPPATLQTTISSPINFSSKLLVPNSCYSGQLLGTLQPDGRFNCILTAFGFSQSGFVTASVNQGPCGSGGRLIDSFGTEGY